MATADIFAIADCSHSSLMTWLRNYQEKSIAKLVTEQVGGAFRRFQSRPICLNEIMVLLTTV